MSLVKGLLIGSAAIMAVTISVQAADLPLRKAAPVDYVRVCDWTGAGFFYIPGTDTCLQISGFVRAEYAYVDNARTFSPTSGVFSPKNTNIARGGSAVGGGTIIPGRNRDQSGFFTRGRLAVDARTQTAYGTLRTYVRYQMDRYGGNYSAGAPGGSSSAAYLDKGFVQFAGITAGRVQSFFDFYADNYNYDAIANSDSSTQVLAYTANFAGGFSAIVSLEDPSVRRDGIGNFYGSSNLATPGNVSFSGARIPDVVGVLRVDQVWGAAQLSAAYHQLPTSTASLGDNGQAFLAKDDNGFAVQGGIQLKLPMLAAGDDLWVEGAYGNGAYRYVDNYGGSNSGFYNVVVGGFQRADRDAYAVFNPVSGTYSLAKSEAYSAMVALNHYFTPNFHDVLYGSYAHSSYGQAAQSVSWTNGGIGASDQFKVGNQFLWDPVKNLELGLDLMYTRINQNIPGLKTAAGGVAATALPAGVASNPDSFVARFRVERDF